MINQIRSFKLQGMSRFLYLSILLFTNVVFISLSSAADSSMLQVIEKEFKNVVKSSRPSVVKVLASYSFPDNLPDGFDLPDEIKQLTISRQDISSGIIIDRKGHIATTTFTLPPRKIEVIYSDNRKVPAKIVGMDELTELMVLKTETTSPIQTKQNNSEDIDTGSWVFTIGSSQGKHPIVSFGIVSGRENLPTHPCADLIKIHAPVSPGNSGGAVVNMSGEVVGMILAVLIDRNRQNILESQFPLPMLNNQVITFAVPIETVKSVSNQIIKHGKVPRGWLGVDIETRNSRVFVTRVKENSPAEKSGLMPEDIILKFNQTPINNFTELLRCVGNTTPNTEVIIKINRSGNNIHYTIKLGER